MAGRVAPDGRRLAFSLRQEKSERDELWLLEGDGRMRQVAVDGLVQAWSPDGTRLACIRWNAGKVANLIVDLVTGQEQLLPLPDADWINDWSPLLACVWTPLPINDHPNQVANKHRCGEGSQARKQ
jgi:hypothetical protein